MHAFFNTGITGTARDDIKLSAFFYNNNVMNTLQLLLVTDKNAGQFQRQLRLYIGLNRRIVDLNKAGAAILPLQIDTNMLQPFFPCC